MLREAALLALNLVLVLAQYYYNPPPALTSCDQTFSSPRFSISTAAWNISNQDLACSFTVSRTGPHVCYLTVIFHKFGLDGSQGCQREFITIGEERLCGNFLGVRQFPFTTASMSIKFRGSSNAPLDIELEQTPCPSPQRDQNCDLVSNGLHTVITSPDYPNVYPSSVDCQYTILQANSAVCEVSVVFEEFQLENSPDCRKDRLLVGGEVFCGALSGYRAYRNFSNNLILRFLSDASVSGRGFRIFVDQIPCNLPLNQTEPETTKENNIFPGYPQECCKRPFNAPYLVITSPGLLDAGNSEWSCLYTITPTTPRSCRLRLHFRHFWLGDEDFYYGCTSGFLEVDGRRLCGCRDGLSFVTYFSGDRKELFYNFRGPGQRGFILEVQQEECDGFNLESFPANNLPTDPNTEIEVFSSNITSQRAVSRFLVPSDSSRCSGHELSDWGDRVRLFLMNAQVPSYCPASEPAVYPPLYPPISPPIYPPPTVPPIYPPPALPPAVPPIYPPPNAVPPLPPIYPPTLPPGPPVAPPIYPPPGLPPLPAPPAIGSGCQVFITTRGGFQSPGWPSGYPPNLRCCFRFRRLPGFCRVLVTVLDFDVEWSFKCWKDYLLMDSRSRFCGHALQATGTILNFRRDGHAHVDFVTDKSLAGRGFRAVFEYVPCAGAFAPLKSAAIQEETQVATTQQTPVQELSVTYPPAEANELTFNVTPL